MPRLAAAGALLVLLAACSAPSVQPGGTYEDPGFSAMCRADPCAGTCKCR